MRSGDRCFNGSKSCVAEPNTRTLRANESKEPHKCSGGLGAPSKRPIQWLEIISTTQIMCYIVQRSGPNISKPLSQSRIDLTQVPHHPGRCPATSPSPRACHRRSRRLRPGPRHPDPGAEPKPEPWERRAGRTVMSTFGPRAPLPSETIPERFLKRSEEVVRDFMCVTQRSQTSALNRQNKNQHSLNMDHTSQSWSPFGQQGPNRPRRNNTGQRDRKADEEARPMS